MKRIPLTFLVVLSSGTLLLSGCGGESPDVDRSGASDPQTPSGAAGLSAVELEQGIGPIRDLELGPVDDALAAEGEALFATKCSACHKIEERFVAPALGDVLSRRRPEFVMNMMLNADEMVQRHPVTRELLAEFYTPMPVQIRDPDQARAILEYLRAQQTADPGAPDTQSGSAGGR